MVGTEGRGRRKGDTANIIKKKQILTKIKVGTLVGHVRHSVEVQTSRARVW